MRRTNGSFRFGEMPATGRFGGRPPWDTGSRPQGLPSSGFTILEVLAAVTLFAVMATAFTSLSLSTLAANHEARRITAAANLARDKIEEFRAADFATIDSGSDATSLTESEGTSGAAAIYSRSWTVANGPVGSTKEVVVTVTWTDGTTRRIELKTLIGS